MSEPAEFISSPSSLFGTHKLGNNKATPKPSQVPVFQQFINFDWNAQLVLNESYLVHKEGNRKITGWSKLMILLFVSSDNEYEAYVKSLSNAKEEVNHAAQYGYTALMIAACYGLTSKCKVLIDNGANLNATTDWHSTALMFCAESLDLHSNFETFELLIESGANVNLTANSDRTALYYAVDVGHVKAVEYLIAHKVEIPQDLFCIEEGVQTVRILFQMHILPLKCWETVPNFYIGELLLKHTQLEVTQNLLAHVCGAISSKPHEYIIDVRGLEVLIEHGAYLTPKILAMRSELLRTLFLQAYSNVSDRQRNKLQENYIVKSIIKEFGNSQESLLFATTLCYMNCDAKLP